MTSDPPARTESPPRLKPGRTPGLKPLARSTFLLGAGLITAALLIGWVSYLYSFRMMERSYQSFYLDKAQMIVRSVEGQAGVDDRRLLEAIDQSWRAAAKRPVDEYICVVDPKGNLLLHSAHPDTVGKYAGDNPILGGDQVQEKRLCELVLSQRDYVGKYISSSGHDQIAAFVPVPGRKWMLGVHRSGSALQQEIANGFFPLVAGFLLVCGLLMPVSLFLIYRTYSLAHRRRLASELALQESEKRYQSLVDSMPQCLYRSDLQGRITFANQALLALWGTDLDHCLGSMMGDYLPADLARSYMADDLQVIRTGQPSDLVVAYAQLDSDRQRFIQVVRTPLFGPQGDILGIQGIFWDVTARQVAEMRLAETRALFETVLQSVPSGILAVDQDRRLTVVNQRAEELMELKAQEVLGRPVREVIPQTRLTEVMESGRTELGKLYPTHGKQLVVSRSPIFRDGRVVGAVSVFNDESELEAVQRQLTETRRLNDEFSLLIKNLHDGVLITDREKVVRVNPAFGRISGIPFSSLEGRPVVELEGGRSLCLGIVREVFSLVRSQGTSVTLRRQLEGGNEVFVTGSPVTDGAGQVERVVINLRDVTELQALEERIRQLSSLGLGEEVLEARLETLGIVAESPVTQNLVDLCRRVAQVDSTVLLRGESGAGKDVMARLIHHLSPRGTKPFVSINCGAIPETLLESELFGYEKGAFSGADREGKRGLFEEADGGTIFLDEIAELPLQIQVKLLTVLQEQRFRRLGSVKDHLVSIRVIAATNRDLDAMVAQGKFREDLYYRLMVVPIEVPPLRQRREDIMPLALSFLKAFNGKYGVSRTLGPEVLREMENHDWPGNVRELQNTVERMVVTADVTILEPRHLPGKMYRPQRPAAPDLALPSGVTLSQARDMVEKQLILEAMQKAGNTREAAKLLGVTHPTVIRKAQKLGLSIDAIAMARGGAEGQKIH